MRRPLFQAGLPLAVLLALPVLGMGERAWAGYVASRLMVGAGAVSVPDELDGLTPRADSWLGDLAEDSPPVSRDHSAVWPRSPRPEPLVLSLHGLLLGFAGSCGETASGTGPSGSSPAGQPLCIFTRAEMTPLRIVGYLVSDVRLSRPPPFASRLFRPPRA